MLVMLAACALLACDSPKSSRVKPSGDAGQGAGVDGGADAGVKKPTMLPGGYEARIQCGALGQSCSAREPCGNHLECAGGTCLPSVPAQTEACGPNGACPAKTPICASPYGVCVTADQLGCLCLEPNSREIITQCRSITDKPDVCIGENGLCDVKPDGCCDGLSCLQGKSAKDQQLLGLCKLACNDDGECDTGCCTSVPSIAGKFCAPLKQCIGECRMQDEECDGLRHPCCDGLVCSTSTTDPALNGCQPSCTKNAECKTNCCVLFELPDGGLADSGICAPSDRCM